jgi:hypothetical protein
MQSEKRETITAGYTLFSHERESRVIHEQKNDVAVT